MAARAPVPPIPQDATTDATSTEYLRAVAMGDDGSVFMAGSTDGSFSGSNAGFNDFAVVKLDINGTELWRWQVGGTFCLLPWQEYRDKCHTACVEHVLSPPFCLRSRLTPIVQTGFPSQNNELICARPGILVYSRIWRRRVAV